MGRNRALDLSLIVRPVRCVASLYDPTRQKTALVIRWSLPWRWPSLSLGGLAHVMMDAHCTVAALRL
ncbi:Pyridoxal reductase [Fusarium oxysporum f. sp. albedinis]|nr:Pyridoxal reductase [Fusarium oxysporum f. sp. albedinis]